MSNLKEVLFGKSCQECEDVGIFCIQVGLLWTCSNGPNNEAIESLVYIDGQQSLQTSEPISKCPILLNQADKQSATDKIKAKAQKLNQTLNFDEYRPPNY